MESPAVEAGVVGNTKARAGTHVMGDPPGLSFVRDALLLPATLDWVRANPGLVLLPPAPGVGHGSPVWPSQSEWGGHVLPGPVEVILVLRTRSGQPARVANLPDQPFRVFSICPSVGHPEHRHSPEPTLPHRVNFVWTSECQKHSYLPDPLSGSTSRPPRSA